MKSFYLRFTTCLLIPIITAGDPALASSLSHAFTPGFSIARPRKTECLTATVFSTEAVNATLIGAFTARVFGRREFIAALAAGFVLAEGETPAAAQTAPPKTLTTIQEAQSYANLQPRFVENSQTLLTELSKIDAAEQHVRAMASRNVWLTFNMDDANRAPRESLTSGLPTVKDVVARFGLGIDGPPKRIESLHPQVDKHWGKMSQNLKTIARLGAQGLKTLFLRGGWTFNSAAQVLLGQVEYYLANIDLASTDAKAFEVWESEWLKIQPAWFDLVIQEVDIRQNQMTDRYHEKLKARERALLPVEAKRSDKKADARTVSILAAIQKIESDMRDLGQKQIQLQGQEQAKANDIVLGELRGPDTDKAVANASASYRPLAPDVRPTLGFVQRVLMSSRERINPASLQAFENVLSKEGASHDAVANPFSLASRTWILDRAWDIPGNRVSIPESEIARDSRFTPSLEKQNEILALTPGELALLAKPSPEQNRLVFAVRRILELIDALLLQKLPRWTLRIFGKLGLDLPIQAAFTDQTLVEDTRTTLLIDEQKALLPGIDAMMIKAQNANEAQLLQARNELATARKALLEAARQSAKLIDQLREAFQVDLGVEGLAYEFEKQLFVMEKSALEAEKAYQKVLYFTQGRPELRRLFEQRRDAYLETRRKNASPPQAAPEKPAIERKDMALPHIASSKGFWTVALGMFGSIIGQAAELGKPLYQSPAAPHWSTWLLIGSSLIWTMVAPHFLNDRYNHGRKRYIFWVSFPMAIVVVLCPFGWVVGSVAAGVAGLLAWQFRPKALTIHRPYSPSYVATYMLDRHEFLTHLGFWGFMAAIVQFTAMPVLYSIRDGIIAFTDFFLSTDLDSRGVGRAAPRWPLNYTAVDNGKLEKINLPPIGAPLPPYLVRWIGPGEAVPADALFVFRSEGGAASIEAQIEKAQSDVRTAQSQEVSAQRVGRDEDVRSARARTDIARANLAAAIAKRDARAEPMPKDIPIQIDRDWPMAAEGTPVKEGGSILLAAQMSSRAAILRLSISPEDAAAIGTGMSESQRRMRLRLKPDNGSHPISIPVAAIQGFYRTPGAENATIVTDPAKGGFPLFKHDAAVLITEDLLKIPNLVPPETLEYLAQLNGNRAARLSALEIDGFEEWKDTDGHGHWDWVPYSEVLAKNVVIAMAELQTTRAAPARVSTPQQTATIDAGAIRSRIKTLQESKPALQTQIDLLPKRDTQAAQDRETLTNQLAAIDTEIQNLQADLRMASGVASNRGAQGIRIGPQQLEVHEKGLWIFARDRVARLLNPWSGRNTKSTPPANAADSGLLSWDPEALEQVSDNNVTIVVRTSLQAFSQAGFSKFSILFPGMDKPDDFEHSFDSTITDPVQNLSKVGVNRAFSGAEAHRRIPIPGSLVPVKFFLPENATIVNTPTSTVQVDDGTGLNSIFKWAAVLPAAVVAYIAYRLIRLRMRKPRVNRRIVREEKPETDYRLDSARSSPRPDALRNARLSEGRLRGMAEDFKMHYLPYEHQDAKGYPTEEHEILFKKFGHTGIWRRQAETRTMTEEFHFRMTKDKYERKNVHMKVILTFFASLLGIIYFAGSGAKAFTLVKTAFWLGNFTWDKLRSDLARFDWHKLLTAHTLLSSPQSVVEAFIPLVILIGLILILGFAGGKMIAEIGAPLYGELKAKWFDKIKETGISKERFRELTKRLNPKGKAMDPDIEIRRIRKDPEGASDPERAVEQKADVFKAEVADLGRLLSERAAIVLTRAAHDYLTEKPENLDGNYFTAGRRQASQARWWATVLETTALDQGTDRALIPVGSGWENPIQYSAEHLETIARDELHMNERTIRERLQARFGDPDERERHWRRIHQEYRDRALVLWAIRETTQRPISTVIAMRAYDLVGIACQPTGDAAEDDAFRDVEHELKNVLGELDLRLTTLSDRAHKLQAEYSRQTPKFQLAYYLYEGFTPENRLTPDRQQLVLDSMVDTEHGFSLVRDRTEEGIRTFEALIQQYYVHGPWPQNMEDEVRRDYQRLLNFTRDDAQARVDQIQEILEGDPMRVFWAWAVSQRLQKSLPDNFETLLADLRTTRSGQRGVFDLRWLSASAPMMDERDRNEATNADLLIADLRGERRLQGLLNSGLAARLPPMAAFVDPALEKNLREGAADLGFMSRFFRRRVHLTALAEVLNPYIARLSSRITSRLSPRQAGNVHVFSKTQSGNILTRATRLFGDAVFLVSQEPSNFAFASDPDLSDPAMQVVSPCNPYVKYQALFIFFNQTLLDGSTLTSAERTDLQTRQQEAVDELQRMNIGVYIGDWSQDIIDRLVPAEDDDHSYNHVLIIRPGHRLLSSTPEEENTIHPTRTHLEQSKHVPRGARRLFGPIWWGDKGALYQVKAGIEFSPHLNSGFTSLRDDEGRLLATSYYHEHTVRAGRLAVRAVYHSWLAVSLALRGLHFGSELVTRRLGVFMELLANKGFAYCFIDADNDRSINNIIKRGYQQVGEFVSSLIARSNPQDSPHMRRADTGDKDAILKLLQDSYADYAFTDFDAETFDPGDSYYVWEVNHTIVAVINAKKQRWLFRRLMRKLFGVIPNIDVLVMPLLPYLPVLKKSFNLTNLSFLKLTNVAFAPGHAQDAVSLIEAAIARRKVYDAWGFFDAKGPVYQELKKAGAFGSAGILNAVQETKVGVYAKAFDNTGEAFLVEAKKRPAFASKENLMWWLFPFVGLSAMLMGTAHKATAAALDTVAPIANQAAQKAVEINIPYIVQNGDSWRRIAHHLLGSEQQYSHLMSMNKELVQKGIAHGSQYLIHPGDQINLLTVHAPAAPVVPMNHIPLSGFDQWLLHPSLTPELAWVAAGILLVIAGVWVWRRMKRGGTAPFWTASRNPLLIPILAVGALAQSLVPGLFRPVVLPKAEIVFNVNPEDSSGLAKPSPVPDVTMETSGHIAGIVPVFPQNAPVDVTAPPAAIKVTPREVPAQAWVRYANDHLQAAVAAHLAGDETADVQREIDQIDLPYFAQLRALLAQLKTSAGDTLSQVDRALIDALDQDLGHREQEAKSRLAQSPAGKPEHLPAVEQLRQEYMAAYARHQAEARTSQPLVPPEQPAQLVRHKRAAALKGAVLKITAPARWIWHKAEGPLIRLGTDKRSQPDSFDPQLETVRAKVDALIRKTKLNEQIARRLFENAEQALHAMGTAPQSIAEEAQHLAAQRNRDVYKRLLEKEEERSQAVKTALTESEDVPGLDADQRFEVALNTAGRWEQVPAGSDQLTADLAAIDARATSGVMPVKGPKKLKGPMKRTMTKTAEASQAAAAATENQRNAAQADLRTQLALAQKLHYLGLSADAYRITETALLFARSQGLLSVADQTFRDPQVAIHFNPSSTLEKDDPDLWALVHPLLDKSKSAEGEFNAFAQEGVQLESEWVWKSNLAAAMNLDPIALFPDLHSRLILALQREAKARAALQTATQALTGLAQTNPDLEFDRVPMNEPTATEPDEVTQARYEQDIAARRQGLSTDGTPAELRGQPVDTESATGGTESETEGQPVAILHMPVNSRGPAALTIIRPSTPPLPPPIAPKPAKKETRKKDERKNQEGKKANPADAKKHFPRPWWTLPGFLLFGGLTLLSGAIGLLWRKLEKGHLFSILGPIAMIGQFLYGVESLRPSIMNNTSSPLPEQRGLSQSA